MNYEDYPKSIRELVWAYAWSAMNFDHAVAPVQMEAVAPSRIKKEVRTLVRYCRFMEVRGVALKDAKDEDNDAWMALFRERHYSGRVRAAAIPKRLYWYRHHLPIEISNVPPWRHRSANDVLGKAPAQDENTTERVPRSIMDPILKWALFYVEVAYANIFELLRHRGVESRPGNIQFSTLPDTSIPWRVTPLSFAEVEREVRYLTTAAYIVAAYLSGMRDGELQSIKRGARTLRRDENGDPYRYLVKSIAYKKTGRSTGKERTWIVLPEVHLALERVEELSDIMRLTAPDELDLRYADNLFRKYGKLRTNYASIQERITDWINDFQRHVNSLAVRASDAAESQVEIDLINNLYRIPPTADGHSWRWRSKQFRRTIAWYIANEPFGTVAGMRQYGHVREVTFQGYAGTIEAGFRDEIDAARAIGKMQDILEMYEDVLEGATLGGPTGARLEKEFSVISAQLGDLPGRIADERRLLGMLKNVAKDVYPGLVNDCFFDAATALCLRRPEVKDHTRPIHAQCDWVKCPNSCFWGKHAPALRASLEEAKEHRRLPGLSKNQRAALTTIIDKNQGALRKLGHAG